MNNILFNDLYYNTRENVCIGGRVKMFFSQYLSSKTIII